MKKIIVYVILLLIILSPSAMAVQWSNASSWATPELNKANDAGLIPQILSGADMTKPITREEFAELAVKLYEKTTETTAVAVSPNPFTDTLNPEILKAFKIGVTQGTSDTTFEPDVLINREQCAAMLFRALKAISPSNDFSVEGVKDFPDQKYISDWANEAVKYMNKIGIITGDSQGNFMPKATTTAQQAQNYGMATREQAIAMSFRSYERFKDSNKDENGSTLSAVGSWTYYASSGNITYGQTLEFKSDGTFVRVVGTLIYNTYDSAAFEGNYTISGDKLVLTNQMSSSSYAEPWDDLWNIFDSLIKDNPVEDQEYTLTIINDDVISINGMEFSRK